MAVTARKSEVDVEANLALTSADNSRKKNIAQYKSEKKVDRYLSPMYRPYFGNVLPIVINGVAIYFPVDGSVNAIPSTFADELDRRRICVDNSIAKQNQMANISENIERNPGELKLF